MGKHINTLVRTALGSVMLASMAADLRPCTLVGTCSKMIRVPFQPLEPSRFDNPAKRRSGWQDGLVQSYLADKPGSSWLFDFCLVASSDCMMI